MPDGSLKAVLSLRNESGQTVVQPFPGAWRLSHRSRTVSDPMFQHRNILLVALSLGVVFPLAAQKSHNHRDCDDWQNDWGERVCETREYTLKGSGSLRVDAHPNG